VILKDPLKSKPIWRAFATRAQLIYLTACSSKFVIQIYNTVSVVCYYMRNPTAH